MLYFISLLDAWIHCVTTKRLFDIKQCVHDLYQEQLKNDVKGLQCSAKGEYAHHGSSGYCVMLRIGHNEGNHAKLVKS